MCCRRSGCSRTAAEKPALRFVQAGPVVSAVPGQPGLRVTAADTIMPQKLARPASWRTDAALAVVVALLALCLHAVSGFPTLAASHGDNDSLLRLVQIRDLLGGQGWFDLHQYRMGPE